MKNKKKNERVIKRKKARNKLVISKFTHKPKKGSNKQKGKKRQKGGRVKNKKITQRGINNQRSIIYKL